MEKTMTEARADALMEDGFHCSQCVFPYAAFRLGMDRDEALRLSAGLGDGDETVPVGVGRRLVRCSDRRCHGTEHRVRL